MITGRHSPVPPLWAAAALMAISMSFANGGPVETSQVHSAGEPGPEFVQRDVELVSEELLLSPGMNFMDVKATYTLFNAGGSLETGYAFHVNAFEYREYHLGEFDPAESIRDFCITLNGEELPFEFAIVRAGETVKYYDTFLRLVNCFGVTNLELAGGDTSVVEVSCSIRASYEDWETSKDFFPGFEDRRFTYDLSPAANWGSGRAGSFTLTMDCRELFAMGGTVVEAPQWGRWITEKLYRMEAENFPMDSLPPLVIAWESREAAMSSHLENTFVSPENYTITVSSSQGGGYGGENLTDGNLDTAWSGAAEGTAGEWILMEFQPGVNIGWVGIVPGLAAGEHLLASSAKPRKVMVNTNLEDYHSMDSVEVREVTWEEITLGTPVRRYAEVFNRGESYPYEWIRITFTEITPGTESENLCVSELVVAGRNHTE